ncbi:MAG: toxin-antitoxin system YwqK family antitoxin [Bacteroidales bacterium]|nr:toxin-antitoxin system YwqK family antitoxin [Bacteroidales bacterium]
MKSIFSIIFIFIASYVWSQNVGQQGDSLVNYKDINGHKHGKWTKQYESGKTAYIAHFKNDKLVGLYQRFYPNGKLIMEVNYEDNESGYAKLYYDDGTLLAEGHYIQKNIKDGLWKFYGTDGKLVVETNYEKGIINGKQTKYYRNGNKMEEIDLINGKKDGLWTRYFENGKERMKARMINDKRNGLLYVYYPSGKYYCKGRYENNLKTGPWVYYNEDGSIKRETEFINGHADDQEQIDEETTKMIEEWEQMKGVIPDPDMDNMMNYDQKYSPLRK